MFTKKRDNVTKIATHAVLAIVVLTVSEFWSLRRIPKFGRVSVVSGPSDSCHSIWFLPRVPRRGLCYPPQSALPLLPSEVSLVHRVLCSLLVS